MPICSTCGAIYEDDSTECVLDGTPLEAGAAEPEPALGPGSELAGHRLEVALGAGAYGEVFRARGPTGAAVAVKVLSPQCSADAQVVARFFAEARSMIRIGHPNIVTVHAYGKLPGGRAYLVMELLEGETLAERLRAQGRLAAGEALGVLRSIADALDAAHALCIAHRDLKPDNVFLCRGGGEASVKLLDFGVAKLLDGSAEVRTTTGTAVGTPAYMAPEQWRGRGVDHRADLFALGILTHELLTGRRPFSGRTAVELMMQVTTGAPAPVSAHAGDLPAAVDAAVLQLLQLDPAARPPSASEAVEAVARALGV